MYQQHREKLYVALKDDVAVLNGARQLTRYNSDRDQPYRQESMFFYFTGCTEQGCAAMFDGKAKSAVLYLPDPDPEYALWYGAVESLDELKAKYGSGIQLKYMADFAGDVAKIGARRAHVIRGIMEIPDVAGLQDPVDDFMLLAGEIRLYKDAHEIAQMHEACRVNTIAFNYVATHYKPGMTELDLVAMHNYATSRQGLGTQAFLSIAAAGSHASSLHWQPTTYRSKEEELILLDAGCENQMYCADQTRVIPVGKRFTKKQEEMYQVCVDSNLAAIAASKPGVPWEEVHFVSSRKTLEGLRKYGLVKSEFPLEEQLEAGIALIFQPHGLGHLLGIDVHDVGAYNNEIKRSTDFRLARLRTRRILAPGMVITVEPGLYFINAMLEQAKKNPAYAKHLNFELIKEYQKECGGYRIEDDIVITETGCDVLPGPTKCLKELYQLRDLAFE